MNQKQVQVVEAQRLQRLVECLAGVVGPVGVVAQLACDEHLAAVQIGPPDRLADLLLVAVHLGRVDVPIAGLQRGADGGHGVLRLDQEYAEAELRDHLAVVQHDVRYRGHDGSLLRKLGVRWSRNDFLHLPTAARSTQPPESHRKCDTEASRVLGCEVVLSEDLGDGQDYGGVLAENPFA